MLIPKPRTFLNSWSQTCVNFLIHVKGTETDGNVKIKKKDMHTKFYLKTSRINLFGRSRDRWEDIRIQFGEPGCKLDSRVWKCPMEDFHTDGYEPLGSEKARDFVTG
jgi:hypothetical protein